MSNDTSTDPELASRSRTHDISRISYHIKDLETFGETLTRAAAAAFPNQGKTRYRNVYVLLLCWEEDNLGVAVELQELDEVLSQTYHFQTQAWRIPSANAHNALAFQLMDFLRNHDDRENLLMIYYGGHGEMNDDRQCVWSCTDLVDSPTVQWYGLQTLLEQARSDVLLLLDCCAAASSAAASGNGVTELIAACGFESWAPGVGEHSFSRSLIEELKYLSYGSPFSAALLHNRVLSRIKYWKPRLNSIIATERRKTPIYIQLANDLNRKSIQLGPLPLQGTGIDSGVYVQPTAQSSTGSTESEDIEMLSPDSSQSSLAEVWPDPGFKCPKVLISIALEDNQQLDREDWTEWLRSVPALTKYMQIQGCYESDSTVILGLISVAVWDLLPKHPAISFISFVRSENLFKSTAPLIKYPSSVFKAANKFLQSLQRHGKSLRPSIIRDRLRIRVVLDEFIRLLERTTYSVDMLIGPNGGSKISSASRSLRSIYIAVDDLSNTNQKGNAESEALTLSRSEDPTARIHPRTLTGETILDIPIQAVVQKESPLPSPSIGSAPAKLKSGGVKSLGLIQQEASTEGRIRRDSISAPPANVGSKSLTQSSSHGSIKVPLRYAVEKGDEALVASAVAASVIEASEENNMTTLHHAIKENNINVVRSLLDTGANIEACDGEKKSPLHLAAKEGHTDMVSLLLTKGANPEARDWYDKTPLHYAAESHSSRSMIPLLCKAGAQVDTRDCHLKTPLHYAVEHAQIGAVEQLLDDHANPTARDAYSKTPLHFAAGKNSSRLIVERLLKNGACVNVYDHLNRTPLHYAVQQNQASIVKALLDDYADANVIDKDKITPLDIASKVRSNSEEILSLLKTHPRRGKSERQVNKTPDVVKAKAKQGKSRQHIFSRLKRSTFTPGRKGRNRDSSDGTADTVELSSRPWAFHPLSGSPPIPPPGQK